MKWTQLIIQAVNYPAGFAYLYVQSDWLIACDYSVGKAGICDVVNGRKSVENY